MVMTVYDFCQISNLHLVEIGESSHQSEEKAKKGRPKKRKS
jgi:hypothetical protein